MNNPAGNEPMPKQAGLNRSAQLSFCYYQDKTQLTTKSAVKKLENMQRLCYSFEIF